MSENSARKIFEPQKGSDGSLYYDLDEKKRVSVKVFKGRMYIDIREYYEKDGDLLPGKKGISLNLGNWEKLKDLADSIDECITDI